MSWDRLAPPPGAWEPPLWHQDALCRGMDPALFFPDRGESGAEAKAVCRQCPVRAECCAAGQHEYYGIWGGQARGRTSRANQRRRREAAA